MFVRGRVAITAAGVTDEKDLTPETNVVFILPKMSYGVRSKVIGEAAKIVTKQQGAQNRQQRRAARSRRGEDSQEMEIDVGTYQLALLVHNIVAWQGPAFADVPCIRENIELLDQDKPLVAKVLEEISDRNSPNDEEPAGELDDPNVIEVAATASATKR
jgi:hypothetical protein